MTTARTVRTRSTKGDARQDGARQDGARKDPGLRDAEAGQAPVNDVRLLGRLSAAPATVELPSGDVLMTFRISVERTAPGGGGRSPGQRVDSIPCSAWAPRLRRSIATWRAGDLVEVVGAVRCRFYQAGGATRSRVEVEATAARIMRRSSVA